MDNLIVFSRGRAGSTSLFRALDSHKELRGIDEPYNPNQFGGSYTSNSLIEFENNINRIFSEFNLMKHTWSLRGWPFGGERPFVLLEALLGVPNTHFVVINRRNVFWRFVSSHISLHSNIWFRDSAEDYEKIRTVAYPPINVLQLEREIEREPQLIQRWLDLLSARNVPFTTLWYEDFYSIESGVAARISILENIFEQFGLNPNDYNREQAEHCMDGSKSKLNDLSSLSLIPNFSELAEKYG